jgi:hypothetical protein
VLWRSPAQRWYLLAAGSPEVTSITLTGSLEHTGSGQTLAVPAAENSRPDLGARLADGSTLSALK